MPRGGGRETARYARRETKRARHEAARRRGNPSVDNKEERGARCARYAVVAAKEAAVAPERYDEGERSRHELGRRRMYTVKLARREISVRAFYSDDEPAKQSR